MSNNIDERVVQMQFNNRQFEAGVGESVRSLDKLKQGLKLDSSAKSLANLNAEGRRFDLSGIANSVENIASRFTAFGVMGVTALANIANAAINTGTQLVKSLTIDPIMAGKSEFETKLNSIQTILANTKKEGTNLETVTNALNELNTYSDKTIYNFQEMARNIGTFTAAGVKLDTSVAAIKGIANLAAVSGSNSQQASTAMYQLSQALSTGTVRLMDWNSVVNAGMGGQVFQDAIMETARVHGVAVDDIIKAEGSFRDSLQKGWLTAGILTETLSKFTGDLSEEELKAMGYTEKQIKGIIDLGNTANDAATKVKTFTQLIDTLREAAQSGWAQSWELIIGNFDESRELFTSINNYIGGLIGASATARNEMLQFWKSNGGRDDLLQAFVNLKDLVEQIIAPIKEVAKVFFPPLTAQRLVDLTKSFREFTERLKIGEVGLGRIKKIASGFFSVISIGVNFIKALYNGIKELINWLRPAGEGILDMTGSFGDWLTRLDETIKKGDVFNKALEKVKTTVEEVSSAVKTGFKKMVTSIEDFTEVDLKTFDGFVETLKKKLEPLSVIGDYVKAGLDWIKETFSKIGPFFAKIGTGIGEMLNKINMSSVVQLFTTGTLATVIVGISRLVNSFKSITDGAGGVLKGITEILDGVKGCLTAWQNDLKAGTLLKIAGAILILAGALLVMSFIDSDKLAGALGAITLLFTELLGSMSIFETIAKGKGFAAMGSVTRGLIALSLAILLLASAAKALGQLDMEELGKGMLGVTGLMALLVGAAKTMEKSSAQLVKSSFGLILFATGVRILVESVRALGQLDTESLIKGMLGLLSVCAILVGMMAASKLGGMGIKESLGLVAMAVAINLLSIAIGSFGRMPTEQLIQGIIALTVVLAELAIFIWLVDEKQMAAMGLSLMGLAAAMIVLALAVKIFAAIPFTSLVKGLGALAVTLGIVTLAVRAMPKNMIGVGVGLLAISVGLVLVAAALKIIATIPAEMLAAGIIALGAALTMIVIAVNAVQGALAGAAAILVVSVALLALALVFKIIGSMPIEAIGIALLAIAGVLLVLGVAAAVLTPLLPSMLLLGAALLVMGIGLAAVGAAALILSIGLSALAVAGLGGVAILLAIGAAMLPLVALTPAILLVGASLLLLSVGVLALGFAMSILGAGLGVIVMLGEAGMQALVTLASTAAIVSEFAVQLLVAGAGMLLFGAGAIVAGLGAIIAGAGLIVLAAGMRAMAKVDMSSIGGLVGLAETLAAASVLLLVASPGLLAGGAALLVFGQGAIQTGEGIKLITMSLSDLGNLVNTVPGMVETGTDAIKAAIKIMIEELLAMISDKKQKFIDKIREITNAISVSLETQQYKFFNAGANVVNGFIAGIKDRTQAAVDAANSMATAVLTATNKRLDIHSPSGRFEEVGKYANMGLAKGLTKYASLATASASDLAENTLRPVVSMAQPRSSSINVAQRPISIASDIATEVQNRSRISNNGDSTSAINPPLDLTGTLTVKVVNDKGEMIGIAHKAIKELFRKESR